MTLRAVVLGAGWAAEGHTIGLRDAGVEVVALCGRTPEPTRQRASELGIAQVGFDWRTALEEIRADIVAIATPGDTHQAMAEHAASLGYHIVCEKPLATTAAAARAMYVAAEQAGVKTAYAPTGRYSPAVIHAQQLLAQGVVGPLVTIDVMHHLFLPSHLPFGWVHDRSRGGGMLCNAFTHLLASVLRMTGGTVTAARGMSQPFAHPVPVGPPVHDFRDLFAPLPGWDPSQATEWRVADADSEYTLCVDLGLPNGNSTHATFRGVLGHYPHPSFIVVNGQTGALHLTGNHGGEDHVQLYDREREAWKDIPLPEGILEMLPSVDDPVQRCWNQFFREFVADVRGEGYAGYPTFRDGWIAMEVIEAAWSGRSWQAQAVTEEIH